MATIKTQLVSGQRRIITKVVNGQRRVSCSCCEGEPFCCMYPADELGNLYGADDLPDAVTVNWTDRFVGSMSKSGSGYAGGGATLQVVNGIWQLSDSDGTRNVGRCLIRGDGNLTQGDDLVEDQFEDQYNVQIVFNPDGPFPSTVNRTVTRVSLCQWRYDDESFESVRIEFRGNMIFINEFSQKWRGIYVDIIRGADAVNAPNQNSPIGEYEVVDLGDETDFTWTVS
jgi:hypothetical protein